MAIHYSIDGEKEELEFSGNLLDLVVEVTYLVRKVYCALRKQSPALAKAFMEMTMKAVGNSDSPAWE